MVKLDNYLRRYTSISAVIDILRRRRLPLLDPQSWDDRNDRHFMRLHKELNGINGLYALCAAQCRETYHHWRVFTNSQDGACIELDRRVLEDTLRRIDGVRFGPVEYLKLDDVEELTPADAGRLPFLKRQAFQPEAEYRVIAETAADQLPAFDIEIPTRCVTKIYLNPWLPEPLAKSVKETLREIAGDWKLEIVRSHLIDSARWKRAGDIVTGKRPAKRRPRGKGQP